MKAVRVLVRVFVWLMFGAALYAVPAIGLRLELEACDIILILALLLALALGVTTAQTYTYQMDGAQDKYLKRALRLQMTFLHASQCWNIASIFMVFVPLYTTCAVIYLSPQAAGNENRILVYSILSLVFSMGVYIVRPQTRSTAYHNGYVVLKDATLAYELAMKSTDDDPPPSEGAAKELRESIKQAEEINASHYNQSQT